MCLCTVYCVLCTVYCVHSTLEYSFISIKYAFWNISMSLCPYVLVISCPYIPMKYMFERLYILENHNVFQYSYVSNTHRYWKHMSIGNI